MQRTLAMIKPDAVAQNAVGPILVAIAEAGLRVVALKLVRLTRPEAEGFYAVHRGRPFFDGLCDFMSSGPAVVLVLEGEDAIRQWRALMGPTDATQAPPHTLRGRFGTSVRQNAVHGSDAPETAAFEIGYHFSGRELGRLG